MSAGLTAGAKIRATVVNYQGIPAAPTSTITDGTPSVGTTDTLDIVLGTYAFTAVAGRRYRAMLTGMVLGGTVANDRYSVNIRNGGAATPTTASTSVASSLHIIVVTGSAGREGVILMGTFVPGTGVQTLGFFVARSVGTGVVTPAGTRELYVEDIGNV